MFESQNDIAASVRTPAGSAGTPDDEIFLGIIGRLAAGVADAMDHLDQSSDAESIHQLRLGIARLRAVLAAFPDILTRREVRHLRRELKWLRLRLAPVREWDVFLTEPALQRNTRNHTLEHGMIAAASAARRLSALDRVALAIRSRRSASLLHDLRALQKRAGGTEPAISLAAIKKNERSGLRRAAAELLTRSLKKARNRGRHIDELSVPELHRLRIGIKHLRYACESLQALFDQARARSYIKAVRDLQDTLGAIQDSAVAQRLAEHLKKDLGRPVHAAADSIHHRHRLHLKERRHRLERQWEAFKRLQPFWSV